MKGRTRWFAWPLRPVRQGGYECHVRIVSNAPLFRAMLTWDGIGFLVPFTMVVVRWRGLTKAAHEAQEKLLRGKL